MGLGAPGTENLLGGNWFSRSLLLPHSEPGSRVEYGSVLTGMHSPALKVKIENKMFVSSFHKTKF